MQTQFPYLGIQRWTDMPGFEVWQSPGGLVWRGTDQEEAFLVALSHRQPGILVEVAEIFNVFGELRPRRLVCYDDRQPKAKKPTK